MLGESGGAVKPILDAPDRQIRACGQGGEAYVGEG